MSTAERPHLLIFNPDQWRGEVLGHLNDPAVKTPNIDRIVQEDGVSFSRSFCQNTVCTPSRCSFMTGWYPHTRGHRTMFYMLQPDEPCLLRDLKEAGYYVWWGGKNDLVPGQSPFDDYCHVKFRAAEEDYARWGYTPRPGNHSDADNPDGWRGQAGSDTYYSFYRGRWDTEGEDIYCDNDWAMVLGALDLIRNYDGDQPLCIFLPLTYPHPPYVVEDPWYSSVDRNALPPRAPTPEGWRGKPSILPGIAELQNLQGWTEERWRELRAVYYGMCERLDHQFGLLMEALRDTGRYEDTAVFLFSDHGDFTGDYGLVEKTQNTFEDVLSRVPFIVKPPANMPVRPRVSDALVELVDFPATVYDMTGITPEHSHFGRTLRPLLAGETDTWRDAVFCEGGRLKGEIQCMELQSNSSKISGLYHPRIRLQTSDDGVWHSKAIMCRTDRYKYVRRVYEQDELYDLAADPREMDNRIDDPSLHEVLNDLKERLLTHYQETCDTVPHRTDNR